MFVCRFPEEKNDIPVQCKYAVCEQHFRATPLVQMVMPLLSLVRNVSARGTLWLVVSIVLLGANVCYTPFMETALLILACDPSYQCQFVNCWKAPDRLFILAAYLCFTLVSTFGVAYPVCMALLLRRRKHMLHEVFFSEVYQGRYQDADNPGNVSKSEWERFVATDPTALGKLYAVFEFDWIYVPPVLLLWKAVLLIPVVFIERGSYEQLLGIALAQFSFSVFIFVTEASSSPLVDVMQEIGAVHQMLLLGLLAINTRQNYAGDTDLSSAIVTLTVLYLAVSAMLLSSVTAEPVIRKLVEDRRIKALLASFALPYSTATNMYVVPSTLHQLVVDTGVIGSLQSSDAVAQTAANPASEEDENPVTMKEVTGESTARRRSTRRDGSHSDVTVVELNDEEAGRHEAASVAGRGRHFSFSISSPKRPTEEDIMAFAEGGNIEFDEYPGALA
jgi:hypothetical protein